MFTVNKSDLNSYVESETIFDYFPKFKQSTSFYFTNIKVPISITTKSKFFFPKFSKVS